MPKLLVEKLHSLEGHKDAIYAMTNDTTSSKFYTSGGDGFVVEWDTKNLPDGHVVAKVENSVYALAVYKKFLIVGHNYEGIHFIDRDTRKETKNIKLGNQAIFDLKIQEKTLYVAMANGELITINLSTYQIIKRAFFLKDRIRQIKFWENEIFLACSDATIKIVDKNLTLLQTVQAHDKSVMALDFHKDCLISVGRDAHINFWEIKEVLKRYHQIPAHMYAINDLVISPDEKYFATCSIDKTIKVWDTKSMRLLKVIDKSRMAGHGTSVNKLFWEDNKTIVSCSDDRTISIWQIKEQL